MYHFATKIPFLRRKTKRKSFIYLPKRLVHSVFNLNLKPIHQNRALFFLSEVLLFQYFRSTTGFISIHSRHIKNIDKNYHRWINSLKESGILLEIPFYRYGEEDPMDNQTKRYKINPDLLSGEPAEIEVPALEVEKNFTDQEKAVIKNLHALSIDEDATQARLQEYISNKEYRSKIKIDEEITDHIVKITHGSTTYTYATKNAIAKAKKNGLSLIKDGQNAFFADKDKFLQEKESHIEAYWQNILQKIKNHDHFAKRSQRNWRMDSTATQIVNEMWQNIKIEGERAISIDLSNSHHQIIGRNIKEGQYDGYMCVKEKAADLEVYAEAAKRGLLYEAVAEKLDLPSRKEAKIPMLKLTYCDARANSREKSALKESFPGLVSLFDGLKQGKDGNRRFAYAIQRQESVLMIDGIFEELTQLGITCLTKHDSVICKESDLGAVKEVVIRHLTAYFGNFAITVDGKKEIY